ncbi:LOW QUALITY PROTEIN: hypothetical protein U9M48_013980 [Paspalum notatum var. saurae]|uniref:Uncharacterized protein n=1 Tax=Paspalum notatum var. saurae TaxID=547442 RepID=A0AAQ3T114_PASNO
MLTDLNTATIEELISQLWVAEEADEDDAREGAVEVAGRLYLTEGRNDAGSRTRRRRAAATSGAARMARTHGAAATAAMRGARRQGRWR